MSNTENSAWLTLRAMNILVLVLQKASHSNDSSLFIQMPPSRSLPCFPHLNQSPPHTASPSATQNQGSAQNSLWATMALSSLFMDKFCCTDLCSDLGSYDLTRR